MKRSKSLTRQLGLVIRNLRVESGMSQVVFGERCGFYQTYISRIEGGSANPTINAIEVIAKALNLSIFELMEKVRLSQK
jgi:transcriptional regulator with XRE-family HTH domain